MKINIKANAQTKTFVFRVTILQSQVLIRFTRMGNQMNGRIENGKFMTIEIIIVFTIKLNKHEHLCETNELSIRYFVLSIIERTPTFSKVLLLNN